MENSEGHCMEHVTVLNTLHFVYDIAALRTFFQRDTGFQVV